MGRSKIDATCLNCGKAFTPYLTEVNRGRGKFCSLRCSTTFSNHKQKGVPAPRRARTGEANGMWQGGISEDNYKYKLVQKYRYPDRVEARAIISRLIRRGKLFRKPCEVCGANMAQAHHDDYSKPLEVRWLCRYHHREVHGGQH